MKSGPETKSKQAELPAEFAPRLRMVTMRLTRHLLRQYDAQTGMSQSLISAMATVARCGPVTLGRLAELERVQPPSMTRIVVQLEERQLVVREMDPNDRRIARVRTTETADALLTELRTRKNEYIAARLAEFTPEELKALQAALPALERLAELGVTRIKARTEGTFKALHNRNYRLFFIGQLVSLIGTWMQTTALAWLVYEITKSPTQIGLIVAVQFVPTLLGSIHGGLLADRFDKRKILIWTQSLLTVQAGALTVVALAHVGTLPVLYALAVVQGAIVTVDNPTRQAFVSEMVGRDELTNAVGLNSAMFNTARILGPAIGGVLIDVIGTTTCFALNTVSFLAVIGGLVAMRPAEFFRGEPAGREKGALRAGLRYAWEEPTLRLVLGMILVIGTLAMNFQVVLPVVAKAVFGGNASLYGFMSAVMGVGALLGALAAATRVKPTMLLLAVSATAFGVAMLLDAVAPSISVEMVALAMTGVASITFMASANATLQLTSRPEMRGRVMAIYMLFFLGSTPIGGPIVGWIGQEWSARWSLAVGGLSCLVAAATTIPSLRPVWQARRVQPGEVVIPVTAEPSAV